MTEKGADETTAEVGPWPKRAAAGFRVPDPVVVDGCEVCASHMDAIRLSRERGDLSAVTDGRVLLQRHLDGGHG